MRKILTFLAAVCCTMLVSVTTAKAALPADDAIIVVDGTDVTDANQSDVLGDGRVSYDDATHTLTLNEADIVDGIIIDATANGGFTVTIHVIGSTIVTNQNAEAIWFQGGNGLIIEGDEEAEFIVKTSGSGSAHYAILCSPNMDNLSLGSPLTVQGGIHLYVDNTLSDVGYATIGCYYYQFIKSSLELYTHDNYYPVDAVFPIADPLDHVTFIEQKGESHAYAYEEAYPVWISGVQMSDGLPKDLSTGLPCLSHFEMSAITSSGPSKILYDPATRVLTLDGGVVLEANGGDAAILINDTENPTEPITILRGTTLFDETIISVKSGSYSPALKALTPVVLDLNGRGIRIESDGIAVSAESDVTFTNSNMTSEGGFWIGSNESNGIYSECGCGTLTINRVEMSIFGKGAVCSNLASIDMKPGTKFAKEDDYEFNGGNLVEKGTTNIVTWDQVFLVINGWYFNAIAHPAEAGSFIFKNGSDEEKPLPYLFTSDETGSLEVVTNAGWKFYNWADFYGDDNPRDVYLSVSYMPKNIIYDAQFSRNIESKETFYSIDKYNRYIYSYAESLREYPFIEVGKIPEVEAGTYIDGAVSGNGKMYAIEYDELGGQSGIISFEYDGLEVSDAKGIVALQAKYNTIRAMAFNKSDKKLYLIAYDNDAYQDVLLCLDPESETSFTELAPIPAAYTGYVYAMAFDSSNKPYILFCNYDGVSLCSVDIASMTVTNIGKLEGAQTSWTYSDYSMLFSESTGELFVQAGGDLFLVDPSTAKADWISNVAHGCALFVGEPRYKISGRCADGQDYWGQVSISVNNPCYEPEGKMVEIFAMAYDGYKFVKWEDGETENPREFTVGKEDKEFVAVFEELPRYKIETTSNDIAMGEAYIEYYGTSWDAVEGEELLLVAQPTSPAYGFVKWDDENTDNPRFFVVGTEPKTFTAIFEELPKYTIAVETADVNGTAEIEGWSSPADLPEGLKVNIKATATTLGYVFDKWDDGVTDNPRTITVTEDKTYTASFKMGTAHTITVDMASGSEYYGYVTLPGGVKSAEYAEGTEVKLEVFVDPYYVGFYEFDEWDDHNTDNPRIITVGTSDETFIASIKSLPTGEVYLQPVDGQQFWGTVNFVESNTSTYYGPTGTVIHALATPISDKYEFVKWSDDVYDNPREITIGVGDTYYYAEFAKKSAAKHTITVEVAAGEETFGEVNINGSGLSGEFEEGASVTLNAIANTGYVFKEWNDGNTNATRTIIVGTADETYTASFEAGVAYTITLAVESGQESMGSVYLPGGATSGSYKEDAVIEINAKANYGFRFVKWDDENTDAKRTITVTEDKTYIASFEVDPDVKPAAVIVAGLGMDAEKNTFIAGEDLPGVLKTGSIVYDATTKTLTLINVDLEVAGDVIALELNEGVKVVIEGNCNLTAVSGSGIVAHNGLITLSGDGKLQISAKDGIELDKSNLTLDGLNLQIVASEFGIVGTSTEKLIVKGGAFSVKGTSGSVAQLGDMELNWCDFQSGYDFANNQVEKSGVLATDAVILDAWPMLTVSPVEKETAKFILTSKKHGDEFTDKGWFEDGDQVTIEIEATDGFVFGHWTDDADWKDTKKRMKETRKYDKGSGDEALSALMYYEAQSDADWFGINNNEFVRFSFSDNAEKVARASNTLTDARGGEFVEDSWVYVDDGAVYTFEFDGTLKDGKDIAEKIDTKYNKKSIGDVTDMAYDLVNDELLAVEGSKLFRVTAAENKEIATFKFEDVETAIVAIAFDADGVLYALGKGDGTEGVLYTVDIDGKDAKLRIVGKKDNGGKIGMKVSDGAQSLAFDPATGELFWGAADYIRVIDLGKMKTNIAGDLGQKEGAQGFIQSLHRMAIAVEVTVKVDKDQAEWGSASVGDETTTAKKTSVSAYFVEGAPVTITATANSGYHFVEWVNPNSKNDNHEEATYEFEAEDITYIAVFEKGEGIQSITIDPTKKVQKVLIDGTIYIFRDGRVYTVTGELMQ